MTQLLISIWFALARLPFFAYRFISTSVSALLALVLFVLARVAKLSVERTTMAILPWLFPLLGSLAVITYFPSLVLWLPKQFY